MQAAGWLFSLVSHYSSLNKKSPGEVEQGGGRWKEREVMRCEGEVKEMRTPVTLLPAEFRAFVGLPAETQWKRERNCSQSGCCG